MSNKSRLRQVLRLGDPAYYGIGLTAAAPTQDIVVTYEPSMSNTALLKLLIEDFEEGFLDAYINPTLVTEIGTPYDLREIRMEKNRETYIKKLKQLYQFIEYRDCVQHFRFGQNWKNGGYHTLVSILGNSRIGGNTDNSRISITPDTTTEHLAPFIDGKIESGMLIVSDEGKEVIRKPVKQLTY